MHDIPILDESDLQIIMHRDCHFGKNFGIMLDYYQKESIGCHPEIEISAIQNLQKIEEALNEDLSDKLLPEHEKGRVKKMRDLYRELRDNYKNGGRLAELLCDLILSEEEEPTKEIEALAKISDSAPLIDLLGSDTFYDPLSPGYGRAPMLAAKVLAKIADPKAITPLFIALKQEDFFYEQEIQNALTSFGSAAKTFLLKVLQQKPLSIDNETAARALCQFSEDKDVTDTALKLLQDPEITQNLALSCYLISLAAEKKEELKSLLNSDLPQEIKEEINFITK
ncbi:MAG: HEAT repeat domain-containing protein [Candidatus Algichlamydia australiensis]|nr:HEAT repeat domain-containing protein [Chlamydiales bacterium]